MSDGPRVLFVCTANRARSPMAEVIARDLLVLAGHEITVISAGFLEPGWPAEREARRVAAQRGLDLDPHRSRQLDDALVDASDLILVMTRDHVLDLTSRWPGVATRTFALGEVALLTRSAPEAVTSEAWRQWATEAAGSDRTELLRGGADIADPMGQGVRAFRRTADTIATHLELLTGTLR